MRTHIPGVVMLLLAGPAEGFVSLNVPGATMTRAFGINTRRVVVGSFELGGRVSGFVATPKPAGGVRHP